MRLTNVAQMRLPPGRVHSYGAVAGDGLRRLPISFDQARHVGAGERPGSWMAVALDLPRACSADELAVAWMGVVARHGTLRSVFTEDEDGLALHEVAVSPGRWRAHGERLSDPRPEVRAVLDEACSPRQPLAHRMCLVRSDDPARPDVVLLAADHAHVDAWSLLVLVRDLTALLDGRVADLPPDPAPFAAHTAALADRPPAPTEVHRRWAQILREGAGGMPTVPLDLGDVSTPCPEVVKVHDVLDPAGVTALERQAQRAGVRMVAMATAAMTAELQAEGAPGLRAVLPVHSRDEQRWHDSVGWFITNSVIECHDPSPTSGAAAVSEAIALGSHALAPILDPVGGMPSTPGMLAVSWLDNRRLPVTVPSGLRPQHVSAVIRTDGVMLWFVLTDDGLHVRCRYPDTPQARAHVGGWLDRVCRRLRADATSPRPV